MYHPIRRDAELMREKQKKKEEAAAAGTSK